MLKFLKETEKTAKSVNEAIAEAMQEAKMMSILKFWTKEQKDFWDSAQRMHT